ncbi:glycosyl hydrolases family 31-domain-containing protein [Lophiotrema nucula]|uniref:Glycosyl hydrolases family 31-domain-containing protein n=1 Tax=Lophiotrema nucula TaxID=690887 RepID=A0A6A5ZFM8_9PLEO|nr:glycosyl hydrolases family 31-domain-containing protein [Lophiotrema nucula]
MSPPHAGNNDRPSLRKLQHTVLFLQSEHLVMARWNLMVSLWALIPAAFSTYTIKLTPSNGLELLDGYETIVKNTAILTGNQNTTVSAVNATSGLSYSFITPTVAKVTLNTSSAFHGARFTTPEDAYFYGVWEYPFNNQITNKNISFDLKGVGNNVGVNWSNARAPFFITSAGYGVYTDTLKMGSYDFKTAGEAQFIFNTTDLVYYIILPTSKNDFKSIIEQYTELSARSEMPPTSGLGPTFWSDDFTLDFHGSVSNAAENVQDVVNHLYYNQIRATSSFADRPYGTGNRSWGNFDFDPKQYPDPEAFLKNLTAYGFDFQVWVANRASPNTNTSLNTKLWNASVENGWFFDNYNPAGGLGPALNLSISAAYDYFETNLEYFPSVGVKGYKIDRGEEGEMPDYVQNEQMSIFIKLVYDTMVQKFGPSNFYNFARSAVDRSRRYTHVWNGDSAANFTGLAYTVASGIRSGLIAFPIWGSDTGGYTREGALAPSAEVWARWMWFSAFSPVYELMLGTNHTPWYPPYNQSTVDVMKQTANLHADLTPYIKSYAHQATKNGLPIIRALFLETPKDAKTWEVNDQYFFGEEFLVAPIVTTGGSRSVYFPVGKSKKYLNYFSKREVHAAGTTANVTVPLTSVPVYVPQGGIIPRGDIYQGNAKWIDDWQPFLIIEVFPSWEVQESSFTYYSGEGANGTAAKISMVTNKEKRTVRVEYEDLGSEAAVLLWCQEGSREINLNRGDSAEPMYGPENRSSTFSPMLRYPLSGTLRPHHFLLSSLWVTPSSSSNNCRCVTTTTMSLLALSNELLDEMLCNLTPQPRDLCAVSLVCRRLRDVSQPLIVRHATMDSQSTRFDAFHRLLSGRPDLWNKVYYLSLEIKKRDLEEGAIKVNNFIRNLRGLREFVIYCPTSLYPVDDRVYHLPFCFEVPADFPKLRSVMWLAPVRLEQVEKCMLLPAIKTLYCQEIRENTKPRALPFELGECVPKSSTLTNLLLSPTDIPVKSLQQLLMLPRCLKRLNIQDKGLSQIDSCEIAEVLDPVQKSLKELLFQGGLRIVRPAGPVELSSFEQLSKLEIPFRYLFTRYSQTRFFTSDTPGFWRGWTELLPKNLEQLKLFHVPKDEVIRMPVYIPETRISEEEFIVCLLDLALAKAGQMNRLQSLILEEQVRYEDTQPHLAAQPASWIPYSIMDKSFAENGIRLESIDDDDYDDDNELDEEDFDDEDLDDVDLEDEELDDEHLDDEDLEEE